MLFVAVLFNVIIVTVCNFVEEERLFFQQLAMNIKVEEAPKVALESMQEKKIIHIWGFTN